MYRWFLSLRYLRARRTNWIGVAGIFVAVSALILILSIMAGFLKESRDHLRGNLADVMIAPRMDRPIRSTGELPPEDPSELLEIVASHPRVEAASVQLQWVGLLMIAGRGEIAEHPLLNDLSMVSLAGIDVETEYATSDLRANLAREPAPGDRVPMYPVDDLDDPFATPSVYRPPGGHRPAPSVLVGAQLAYGMDLQKGSEVTLVTASIDRRTGRVHRSGSNLTFVVAGTFRSGENEMDMGRVYLERQVMADVIDRDAAWSHVLARLKDYERDKQVVVSDLKRDLFARGLIHDPFMYREVRTWEDFRGNLLGAIENEKSLMGVMLSLVMLVAGFTVFAIHSMLVSEKRRDIGILCALGATPGGIMTTFLLIGTWEVLVGATLGTAAGVASAIHIDSIERWLSSTFGVQIFDRTIYYFDHIPSSIDVVGVATIVGGAVICTLLFSAIPAWRAARLDPIDALRSE